jgi:hypothetical protein
MTQLELKNHQVWQDFTKILENIDTNVLLKEHLEACDDKVCGYWDYPSLSSVILCWKWLVHLKMIRSLTKCWKQLQIIATN